MGQHIETYSLQNSYIRLRVTTAGASLMSLEVKDDKDDWVDVVLGYDNPRTYIDDNAPCFGSTIGRNANRIKGASFKIDEQEYQLPRNEGDNNLHSGPNGYHVRIWELKNQTEESLTFALHSPHLDQGFPGELDMTVTYGIVNNTLSISYQGLSDKATLFNPTNHSYFNLNGHNSGDIYQHSLQIPSDYFMPLGLDSVPLGYREAVLGTPFDVRQPVFIGEILAKKNEQLRIGTGLDHHFVLEDTEKCVILSASKTGIEMTVQTDMPGVQIYTGNFLDTIDGKKGAMYHKHSGVCLETQFCPNGMNNEGEVSPLVEPNNQVHYTSRFTFGIKQGDKQL